MEVTLKIATSKEPAGVYISGSMNFKSARGLDKYMQTVRVARNWLAAQEKAKNGDAGATPPPQA